MEKYRPKKLWNHYFVLVVIIYLCAMLVMRLLDNTLAIYAKTVADSESYGGNLTTFFTLGSIVTAALCGRLIDRTRRYWIVLGSLLLFMVSVLLCAVAAEKWQMYILRALQGASKAAFSVASCAMVADVVPKERMGEGIGFYGFGTAISMAIGPLIGLLLVSDGSFDKLFLVAAGVLASGLIMGLFLNYEKGSPRPAAQAVQPVSESAGNERGIWKFFEKKALPASIVQFCSHAGAASVIVFAMLYATEVLNYGTLPIALFYLVMAASMSVMRIMSGRAVDRGKTALVAVISLGGAVVGYLMMGFLARSSVVFFILAGGFYGLCHGGSASAMNAQAVVSSPASRRGAASSTFNFFIDFGMFVASYVFGLVVESFGYTVMYVCAACCAALGAALSIVFFGRKKVKSAD